VRRTLSILIILATITLQLFVTPVFGQSTSDVEKLEIAFWPEFDQPAVLVFYRILLAEGSDLPTRISVPIPAEAGAPSAVAWGDDDGVLHDTSYEREVSGAWATITLVVEGRLGWVEFYQDLQFEGAERHFEFTWPEGYAAELLTYEIQEPVGASDIAIEPAPATSGSGLYGLNYYQAELGPLNPDTEISIEISYTKSDDTLTEDTLVPSSPLPTNEPVMPTGGTPDVAEFLPWIIGITGGLLVLVAGVLLIRYRSDQLKRKKQHKPRRPRKPKKSGSAELEASLVFCHNCGAKASASDFYCRRCGTQLRR
jgi:hypothetical protein